MTDAVHKPDRQLSDPKELLLGFLDYYRSAVIRKLEGLTDPELRSSRLPPAGRRWSCSNTSCTWSDGG